MLEPGQHRYALARESTDALAVAELSDADLRELGFTIDHRKRILAALREPSPAPFVSVPANPNIAKFPFSFATLSATRVCRNAWTLKTCVIC